MMSSLEQRRSAKKKVNFGYSAYRFRKDEQDPIVDQLKTIFADASVTVNKAAEEAGVSPQTLSNWWNGKTRRPQFATCAAFARSRGYDFVLAPMDADNMSLDAHTTGRIMKRFPSARDLRDK